MARKKRIWYPKAIYHIMSRGNRRISIFKDQWDYRIFLEMLKIVRNQYPFKIHAICLMTNHFHLEIETLDVEIWKIMQKLLSIYAEQFNHRHEFTGHLFEGRYTSRLIEDERYFLEVSRYIHLNPVKAQMVREPMAYEYSSYNLFIGQEKEEPEKGQGLQTLFKELVDTSRVLSYFQDNSREQYRMFVEGKISHAEQEMQIQKDMKEDDMW